MKPDTKVILGGIAFERFETPEAISFGGEQRHAVHELVGGSRVIDTIGATPSDKDWSGIFQGSNALARALAFDKLRKAGKPVTLTWSQFSFTVVIHTFKADYQKSHFIPYSISCVVAADNAASKPASDKSVDAMMKDDAANAVKQASGIGDTSLISAVASVRSAVAGVARFIDASQATLTGVLAPINAARAVAGGLIGQFTDAAGPDIEAALDGNGDLAEALRAGATQANALANLYALDATLSRMGANIDGVGGSGALVIQAGGDLYRLATDNYGDVTAWVDIARANALVDPMLDGVNELRLPPSARATDGVLTS